MIIILAAWLGVCLVYFATDIGGEIKSYRSDVAKHRAEQVKVAERQRQAEADMALGDAVAHLDPVDWFTLAKLGWEPAIAQVELAQAGLPWLGEPRPAPVDPVEQTTRALRVVNGGWL